MSDNMNKPANSRIIEGMMFIAPFISGILMMSAIWALNITTGAYFYCDVVSIPITLILTIQGVFAQNVGQQLDETRMAVVSLRGELAILKQRLGE